MSAGIDDLALGHLAQLHANAATLHVHLHQAWSAARYPAGADGRRVTAPPSPLSAELSAAADAMAKAEARIKDAMDLVRQGAVA